MKEESSSRRIISQAEKKDIMWNIIQPGDPYDIRKSMIAKLPGQTKFMGPHLQLVCLLQAAEIERLCIFLEEYKVKIRESERLELDRHSYQVQIKELSEKVAELNVFKVQTEKLKDYIRKQTIELEQLQKQQNNIGLSTKYQNSLRQIHALIQQNDGLKESINRARNEANTFQLQNKMIEQAKIRQLEVIRQELETFISNKIEQDQRFTEKTNKWDQQRKRLETQISTISRRNDEMLENFRDLEGVNQTLKRQLEKAKYEAARVDQYKKTFKEYEDRFIKVAEEIDRLNEVLKEKTRLLNEQYQRSKQLTQNIRSKDQELVQNEQTINELQRSNSILQRQHRQVLVSLGGMEQNKIMIKSYEASLQQFSIEVERLNNILLKKQTEVDQLKSKNTEYQKKIRILEISERQISEYKIKYGEIIKKITDCELQNGRLSQDIENLQFELEKAIRQKELAQLRNKNNEKQFENLQKTIASLSSQIDKRTFQRQSEAESEYLAEIQKLNNINSELKQSSLENEEKIAYYMRQVKLLESQLRENEGYSKLFRSIYGSSEQLKGAALSSQNKQQYVNDLKKKIKVLQLELKNVQSSLPHIRPSSHQSRTGKDDSRQEQAKSSKDQLYQLKDILLNKEIQISRLTQINEELRELVHNYKQRLHQSSPFNEEKEEENYPVAVSPRKQITKMEKQAIRKATSKQWEIEKEEQMPFAHQQRRQRPIVEPKDLSERNKIEMEIPPHKILDKSKQKRQPGQKKQDYQRPSSQYRKNIEDYPQESRRSQQTYQEKERSGLREQNLQRNQQLLPEIPDPSIFKRYLQERENQEPSPALASDLREKYQQLLNTYENLTQSYQRLGRELRNSQDQRQSNDSYISLLTDRIELLNNQLSLLKQRTDPKMYLENQEGDLKQSYSLLLSKYNNAVFDNDSLRTRIRGTREPTPQFGSEGINQNESRKLYAQNEELKASCAKFSQYYNQILMVNDELERVNKILMEKERDIKAKDILIRDYEVQQLNYQAQVRDLENQVREFAGQSKISLPYSIQKDSPDKLSRELNRLRKRNSDLERIVKGYELEEPKFQVHSSQNEERLKLINQIESMSQEIARLNSMLANRKMDIEVLEEKNKSLGRSIVEGQKSSRVAQDNNETIKKYEANIVLLSHEVERLNGLLRIKDQNNNSLKLQFNEHQDLTKKQLATYAQETDRLHEEISSLRSQVDKVRGRDQSGKPLSSGNISDYENRLVELSRQIDRLNRILISSRKQLNDLNAKDLKYRSDIQRLNNSLRLKVEESIMSEGRQRAFAEQKRLLNRQIQEKSRQYEALAERDRTIEEENAKFKFHLNEYEKRIKGLYEECERLQRIAGYSKTYTFTLDKEGEYSIGQLIQKNRFLIEEIERLNAVIIKQTQDISDLRLTLSDDSSLQRRINEDLALFVVLFAEIESLRNRITEQEREIQQVRKTSILSRKV